MYTTCSRYVPAEVAAGEAAAGVALLGCAGALVPATPAALAAAAEAAAL